MILPVGANRLLNYENVCEAHESLCNYGTAAPAPRLAATGHVLNCRAAAASTALFNYPPTTLWEKFSRWPC